MGVDKGVRVDRVGGVVRILSTPPLKLHLPRSKRCHPSFQKGMGKIGMYLVLKLINLHNQKNTTWCRMCCPTGVYRDGMTIRYRPVGHYTSVPSFDFWLCTFIYLASIEVVVGLHLHCIVWFQCNYFVNLN